MISIYRLTNNKTKQNYVGKSTVPLQRKLQTHQEDYGTGMSNHISRLLFDAEGTVTIHLLQECDEGTVNDRLIHHRTVVNCLNRVTSKTGKSKKEYIKTYMRRKILCDVCDKYISYGSLWSHRKSKKHIANIKGKCIKVEDTK